MHGLRAKNIKLFNSQQEWKIANIAMDIVVNHFIVKSFGLSRKEIDPENKYCWVDTVIPKSNVGDNASFEVYYNIIKNEVKKNPKKFVSMDSLDDHSGLDSFSAEDFDEVMNDKMSNSIEKDVDSTPFMREKIDKEAADLKKSLAGDQKGSNWISVKKPRVPPKKKWESIIKNWTQKYSSQSDEESWVKEDRRLASFSNNVLMPGYLDDDSKDKKRVKAWFFIDVSGSCIDMAPRFLKAIASIPPHIFDIRTFVFDIRVTEVDPKTVEVRDLGGGTSFRAINDYVNSNTPIKSDLDAIFVITDGYGDDFIPKNPKDWTFILSQDFYVSLPTGVNKVLLTQFE
jgi:predicted metal-dependent peptidase